MDPSGTLELTGHSCEDFPITEKRRNKVKYLT